MRFEERAGIGPLTHLPITHMDDAQLMEAYVLASGHAHLAECQHCKARFDDLGAALEQMREDAVSEADRVFTSEKLHEQRDRILRRLERQGHPAEVLPFPSRSSQYPAVNRVLGPARRWIAGAAAAGLAAGVFLGFAVDHSTAVRTENRVLQAPALAEAMARTRRADPRDEQILSDIEDALVGPRHVLELRAIDVMTTPAELQRASFDLP
jgi:hypothetical protein